MKYIILAIGDEILAGQVTDTNSGAIARMMEPEGWELLRTEVIADSPAALEEALARAMADANVVLTTGGLGPTKDDRTKQTLCRLFGARLVKSEEVLANVKRVIEARSLKLNDLTAAQALVPDCAEIIQNEVGTAPIMWFERPDDRVVVCMPGVPFETLRMMERGVKPKLLRRFPSRDTIVRHTVVACNISESALAQILAPWEETLPEFASLAYLPKPGIIRLRLDGRSDSDIRPRMQALRDELISHIPPENLLATADVTPEQRLLELLGERGLTVATAESCTGGTIASRLTSVAGASRVFKGSIVAYSNEVKEHVLGVNPYDLASHGAVSATVVEQMAQGVRSLLDTDFAIATSGIAGPDGGTPEKPVGTVWIGLATRGGKTSSALYRFPGTRDRVIDRSVTTAILRVCLELTDENN